MERLTVRVKEGNRKDECFIPGNKNAIKKVEYICEGERWESEEYKGKAVDKLAEYEDLEEQNKLLKLPCAVGDTVYEVQDFRKRIQPYTIIAVHVSNCGNLYGWELKDGKGVYSNVNGFSEYDLGKSVFLTREEAEAALKELERGKGE